MTTAVASGTSQTLPFFSGLKSSAGSDSREAAPGNPGSSTAKEGTVFPADTVSISSRQSKLETADPEKEKTKKDENKKDDAAADREKPDKPTAKVQFVYNQSGDLSVRYMDTASRVIYQIPSELMMRLKEMEARTNSSVDTKV